MVPYVRKSFFKHWQDGHTYLMKDSYAEKLVFFENMSIEDPYYKKNLEVYNYALDMTKRELKQSVEAMYHNLNSLQSRSGN
jgi:ribonucleoside-triphosphate reductase